MRFAILILVLSIWIVNNSIIKNGCTTKQNKISIYPTTNEILTWQIKQEFFDGADLTYALNDTQQKEFQIIHPIEQTKRDSSHKNVASNVIAAKVASKAESGFWLNLFVFLDQTDDEVYLNIANGTDINKSPNFNQRYLITKRNDSQINCFDVDFSSTQQYLVDCQRKVVLQNETILENIFFVLSKDGSKIQSFTEKAYIQTFKQRSIGQYIITNAIGVTHQYLFRFTPAYSIRLDSELADDSLVEVYLMSESGEPQNTNFVLDKAVLAESLGVPSVNFSLVDYSVQPNGDIYLLDAYNGLYIVNYLPNGEWKIQNVIYPRTGQSFAFSVNSFIKEDETLAHFIVVQGYNYFVLIENSELKYIYDLPFIQLEYPAYIKLSQENVILRNEHTIYLYNIDTQNMQLNSRFTLSQKDVILLNPYLPDLVVISNLLTKRYTLSMGYLKYMGSTETKALKDIILTAYAPNEQNCSVTISYQILDDKDSKLYKLSDSVNPFPKTLLEGSTQKELQPQASGPNQQFELLKNKLEDNQVTGIINKRWILNSNNPIVWPTKVLYADVLVSEKQTQFYQIIQSDDFIIQIWLCEQYSIFESDFNCDKILNINLGVAITKQTFTLWFHDLKNIYFMYRDTEFSVTIKYFYGELKILKRLSFDSKNPLNKIKSLFFADNYFFIIKEDDTIIAYSTYSHDNEILATIDSETFKPYGYTLNWKPQRLFGNRKLHPNLLFIVNQENIVLVDFHNKFTFLQQYAFQNGLEVEFAIGENTFFIVYGQSTQGANDGKIEEYDFSRLNNIFKIKTVQLYWYQITSPLTVDQSEENGKLFIRAYCKHSQKAHILVFNPDTLQHDSLYDAWSISDQIIADNDKVIMAVDGDQQMFLYVFVKGQTTLISELKNSVMTLKVNLESEDYNTKMNLTLSVSNYKFPDEPSNTVEIKKQVQIINTQSLIQIDNSIFPLSKNGVIINSNVRSKKVDLGTRWFTGQVVGIDLECEQCENHISVQNVVEMNNQKVFNGFEIRDLIKYDDSTNIFVATKGLIFTNPDNSLKAIYHFDLPTATYRCYQAQVSADKLLIYALCEDKGQYSIYVTGCISVTGCSPLGEKFRLEQTSKIQLIDNDIMVVLHTNNLEYSDVDGRIAIYQIKKGLYTWNLEVLDVIATQTLNSQLHQPLEYFRPSDFTIIKQFKTETQQTLYKLIISNSKNGLVFYDFTLNNFRYQFESVESLDLYQYLNYEVDQYAFENTHFQQIRLIEQPKYNPTEQSIQFQLLVQTNNAAHYGISFQFKKSIDSQSTKIESKQLDFVLNRYSNWPSINKIAVNSNYIAIPYFNDNSLLIGLYQKSSVSPMTIVSGTYLQYYQGQFLSTLNMALFFDLQQQEQLYASELTGPLNSYTLQNSPIILFNNKNGDLKSQNVVVILQNDFNIEKTQFELQIKPIDQNECTTKITNIKIYPSTSEILQWQLSNGIFEGVGLQYSLDNNQDFTIVQPINKVSSSQHMTTAIGTVQSIKSQNSWNGHFAFLDKSAISNGLYYTKTQAQKNEAPHFTDMVHIDPEIPSIQCFDFDYLSMDPESSDSFLIDCQYQSQKIIYQIKEKQLKAISKIESQFTINKLRWFNKFYNNQGLSYFVRLTPAFSNSQEDQVGKVSLVELFYFNSNDITLQSTIDNTVLAGLLKKEKTDFMLVDYKVQNDGILFLLDQKLGLIKLQFDFKSQSWKLLDQLHLNLQQFIAFDIDDYTNEQGQVVQHTVLLSYNYFLVLENKVIVKVRDLEYFTATYPQHIELRQKNVFIKNDNTLFIYGFSDQSITLLDQSVIQGGYLVDKEKQYITVGQKESNLYHYSQGALKYEFKSGQIKEGEIKIQALSINNQQCQSNIKYSLIKSDDQSIYKKTDSESPFPNAVDETTSIDLGGLTSGPNQQYEVIWEVPEGNPLIVNSFKDDQVKVIQGTIYGTQGLPITQLFQSSIVTTKLIYKIVQQKDKSLLIFSALINDDPDTKSFKFSEIGKSINVSVELNDQTFTMWNKQDSDFVYFATLINKHQLDIYRIFQVWKIELIQTLQFPQEDDDQEIISILNQGTDLLILIKNGLLISLNIQDLKMQNCLSETQLKKFNFEWKPLKLFGNRILKSNILFVQNEKNILILNQVDNKFNLIQSIDYNMNNEIYISAAQNTFFLVNNKEIFEYNYENLLNVYKSKTVELFGYQIVNPLLVTSQLSTGNLIIKTKKGEKNYLNIFKPSQAQHDTFYLTYELDTVNSALSVANDDSMFISLNNALQSSILKVEQSPLLVFDPKFDAKTYLKNIKVTLNVKNKDDDKNQAKFIQTLKFQNSYSQLSLNNVNYSIQTNSTQTVEIEIAEAVIGQTIQTSLKTFYDTQGQISLKSRVQLIKNQNITNSQINYGYSKDQNDSSSFLIYLQAKNTLLLGVNEGDNLAFIQADYTLPDQYNCFRLDNYQNRFYSICNNGNENELVLSDCENQNCKLIQSYIPIPNGNQVIAPYENYVFVLFYNPSDPKEQDGEYKVYKMIYEGDFYIQKEVMTINLEFIQQNINSKATKYRPSSMTGVGTQIDKDLYIYLLMVTNCLDELMFNNFVFQQGDIQPSGISSISLKKLLNNYIIDQTLFLSTQVISSKFENDNLTVELVILTSDSGSFQIMLKFKYNKEGKKFENQQSELIRAFVKYGDWKVLNYLTVDKSSIAVAYHNENKVTVGVYQYTKESSFVLISGGYQFEVTNIQDLSSQNFLMLLQSNYLFGSNPNNKGLEKYSLNSNNLIIIQDPQKQESQNLTLTFSNDFSTIQQKFQLQIIPNNDDDDESKGLGAVWIVLIVLGSFVCLILMGYGYYKTQSPKEEEGDQLV
ncbi:unnamed protein product [Paramecium sonneborni]|uniref:Uncharacterized protein n=1 Tax=Paramecium sonneborni TaxID=65129 RepID=A0A8S1QZA3_9CILI|nr:unnamed protein product [Paramecium sonneborni]